MSPHHDCGADAWADLVKEDPPAQVLTFSLGDDLFAIDVLRVQEIRGFSDVTPVPTAPAYVKGIMNLRGTVIPVMDLRLRFGLPARPYDNLTLVVVVKAASKLVGVVVDAVSAVLAVPPGSLTDPPEMTGDARATVDAVARLKDRLALLLNLEAVVGAALGVGASPANPGAD